jgi:hypothetical protein
MSPTGEPAGVFGELPAPARRGSLDELVTQLRRLKIWAGAPSYESITARVNTAWAGDCVRARPSGLGHVWIPVAAWPGRRCGVVERPGR